MGIDGNSMVIDWDLVKRKTLWHYEKLIAKIANVLDYDFVQEYYSHDMTEAIIYAENIRQGYQQNQKESDFIGEIKTHFENLRLLGIQNYQDLVGRVSTKAKCEQFIRETGFDFEALIQVLNYLFRWVLPFKIPLKELADISPHAQTTHMKILKDRGIRSNLDVLETFRTNKSRQRFSTETGIEENYVLELTHRADLSRLAYVRGKTIMHLSGGGYNTIDKLGNADITKMEADMTAYYESIGKSFADFKTVIPLAWMIGGAQILPKIVEE